MTKGSSRKINPTTNRRMQMETAFIVENQAITFVIADIENSVNKMSIRPMMQTW